jgi:molybdopterin synthase sulfur carrier subunit
MLKILYFGRLSDRAARREANIELPASITSLTALKSWLNKEHDLDGALEDASIKTMVNQTLIHGDLNLNGSEEIGFLPPVGGG